MADIGTSRLRATVFWLIVTLCGVVTAGLVTTIAALITLVLHGDAMQIFMIAGATFAACLTLEIALASLYVAGRRPT